MTVTRAIQHYLTARTPLDDNQPLLTNQHLPLFARHDKKASKRILSISRWTAANIITYWVHQALPPDIRTKLHQQQVTISPQTFRHYFVITTLQRTGNLNEAQLLARHTDTATTRRYLQYTDHNSDQ
jgi:integrase